MDVVLKLAQMTEAKDTFQHDLGLAQAEIANKRLGHLYHLKPTLEFIKNNPEYWADTIDQYANMLVGVFQADGDDRKLIEVAEGLRKPTTHMNARQLLEAFAGRENEVSVIVQSI